MKIFLNTIKLTPMEGEQRNVWTFEGEVYRKHIQFNYYDSGSHSTFIPVLSGLHYDGKNDEIHMIEEALNNWIMENEDRLDELDDDSIIRLDLRDTAGFQDSPRRFSNGQLAREVKLAAEEHVNSGCDDSLQDMKELLKEAARRLRKKSLRTHFSLQNLSTFFKEHPEWKADIKQDQDVVHRLSRTAPPRMHKKAFHHQSLRRFLRR